MHPTLFSGLTSLFTCGGFFYNNTLRELDDVEIIDLPSLEGSSPDTTCNVVPQMPIAKGDNFAIWDEGDKSVLCCGGEGDPDDDSDSPRRCLKYAGDEWIDLGDILLDQRTYSTAVQLSDGRFWIAGSYYRYKLQKCSIVRVRCTGLGKS